ncbi:pimeloyl-ACP methyl ester carboxylesterase [Ureibacillus xyleni]|uniref:Pimeloyl-ACP methyl ester carboxylesterase n=1 Tax=Ureibacillus xyleni TaxID=614648 RepID=A0A285TNI6_9BACL|nr:alpha/beta hydrolase [Ureibacillus xyleni]SOC24338.1 pimeloyl-ACP methyl ester carboxylesterase [Ureibacillus xyleni]
MKRKIWIVVRNLLLILLSIFLLWMIINLIMTKYEQKKYQAIGHYVEVEGKKMHVYEKGEGEHTVVLLSGLGTTAPALDFEPLINEIEKNNKVVVIEPFGYGWSDVTKKERTVENIVEEIRVALQKSKIEGPYILMPHSVSGIYSMYYANQYPDEVEAVIGIDSTLPMATEYFQETAPSLPGFLKFVAPTGIARAAVNIIPDNFLPIAAEGTYSNENLSMTKRLSAWKAYNRNVIEEAQQLGNNIEKTKNMTFPSTMPVLMFTTEEDQVNEEGKSNITFYQEQLRNQEISKLITLEGHHYLHWTQYQEMSEQVDKFIKSYTEAK